MALALRPAWVALGPALRCGMCLACAAAVVPVSVDLRTLLPEDLGMVTRRL